MTNSRLKYLLLCLLVFNTFHSISQNPGNDTLDSPRLAKVLSIKKLNHVYLIHIETNSEIRACYSITRRKNKNSCDKIKVGEMYDFNLCNEFAFIRWQPHAFVFEIEGVLIDYSMRRSGWLDRILNLDGLCLTQ